MGGKHTGANYDLAKAEADKVDAQIITSYKILLMGKPHIYTNIFLVSPNCRSCYMEASSQIQNLLCLSLLHLCSSFFHYLTLNQVGPRSEPQTETEETI